MIEEDVVDCRLQLKGESAERFHRVKEKRGLLKDVELVRQLIKESVDRELQGQAEERAA